MLDCKFVSIFYSSRYHSSKHYFVLDRTRTLRFTSFDSRAFLRYGPREQKSAGYGPKDNLRIVLYTEVSVTLGAWLGILAADALDHFELQDLALKQFVSAQDNFSRLNGRRIGGFLRWWTFFLFSEVCWLFYLCLDEWVIEEVRFKNIGDLICWRFEWICQCCFGKRVLWCFEGVLGLNSVGKWVSWLGCGRFAWVGWLSIFVDLVVLVVE